MKRSLSASTSEQPAKHRKVKHNTYQKWVRQYDCECNDILNDLLVLNADKVPLQEFSSEAAIDLWWKAKNRKPTHGPRKQYKKHTLHMVKHRRLQSQAQTAVRRRRMKGTSCC